MNRVHPASGLRYTTLEEKSQSNKIPPSRLRLGRLL
jgi:hypothetical protein